MRRRLALTLLALICVTPAVTYAQTKVDKQAKRKLTEILEDFNEEMRGYERELKYFEKAQVIEPLLEIRKDLVKQSAEMGKLEKAGKGSGPAIKKLAEEMDANATKLDEKTTVVEEHAKKVAKKADREVAERMRTHADEILESTGEMIKMFKVR